MLKQLYAVYDSNTHGLKQHSVKGWGSGTAAGAGMHGSRTCAEAG